MRQPVHCHTRPSFNSLRRRVCPGCCPVVLHALHRTCARPRRDGLVVSVSWTGCVGDPRSRNISDLPVARILREPVCVPGADEPALRSHAPWIPPYVPQGHGTKTVPQATRRGCTSLPCVRTRIEIHGGQMLLLVPRYLGTTVERASGQFVDHCDNGTASVLCTALLSLLSVPSASGTYAKRSKLWLSQG